MSLKKWGILILATLFILKIESLYTGLSFTYPDEGQIVKVDEFEVFYRQIGSGPDVLFLHGIGASQNVWGKLEPYLSSQFRMTMVDIPGFGRSSRISSVNYDSEAHTKRLIRFIKEAKINPQYIVGNSMGGMLALRLALKYPDRFPRVIALNPATDPKLVAFPYHQYSWLAYPVYWMMNRLTMYFSMRIIFFDRSNITWDRMSYSIKNQESGPQTLEILLKSTKALDDPQMPYIFSKISSSVLILGGKEDQVVAPKYLEELHSVIATSKLYLHPFGGHHLMEDQPEWVAQKVLEHLE